VRSDTIRNIVAFTLGMCWWVVSAPTVLAADENEAQQQTSQPQSKGTRVTIYPLLAKAPIFGATIDLPALPSGPGNPGGGGTGEAGDVSGSTDLTINGAYMGGVLIESNRWFAEVNFLWTALSASHPLPNITVDSDAYFYNGRGGVRLFDGISATVGFRRQTLDLDVTLSAPSVVTGLLEGRAKLSNWNPLLGVDYRHDFAGDRWTFDANFQGGGFGVGNDVDLGGDAHIRWRPFRHFELRAGASVYHFKLTIADVQIGSFERELITTQTLYGPELGFGIVF